MKRPRVAPDAGPLLAAPSTAATPRGLPTMRESSPAWCPAARSDGTLPQDSCVSGLCPPAASLLVDEPPRPPFGPGGSGVGPASTALCSSRSLARVYHHSGHWHLHGELRGRPTGQRKATVTKKFAARDARKQRHFNFPIFFSNFQIFLKN